jgi:hypothetical protein
MPPCSDLERDAEKWMPVFQQNRAQTNGHILRIPAFHALLTLVSSNNPERRSAGLL